MEALKELSRLAGEQDRQRFPNVPEFALPKPKFSDKDSNGLTHCIIEYLRLNKHYATRINTQGQYSEKLKRWIKGNTTKGTADIHACIDGRHASIEIKIGRDTQSDLQKKTQIAIEKAGGLYFVARTFESFYDWYNSS